MAAFNGREAVVAQLLSMGADVNKEDIFGHSPIDVTDTKKVKDMLVAHKKKQQEQVQPKGEATSNGQAVPTVVDESQWFQAAEQGDLAVIQQGINDKIDVNCQDSKGRTAVYWAAKEGHSQLVEYLVTQHADLHIADVSGVGVVFCCVVHNYCIPTNTCLNSANTYPIRTNT